MKTIEIPMERLEALEAMERDYRALLVLAGGPGGDMTVREALRNVPSMAPAEGIDLTPAERRPLPPPPPPSKADLRTAIELATARWKDMAVEVKPSVEAQLAIALHMVFTLVLDDIWDWDPATPPVIRPETVAAIRSIVEAGPGELFTVGRSIDIMIVALSHAPDDWAKVLSNMRRVGLDAVASYFEGMAAP